MSYSDVLAGLHTRLDTVSGLTVVMGEPASVQTSPLLYSALENVTREVQGTTVRVTYRTLHRLCIRWGEREQAEAELAALVNAIPMTIDASPRLGGQTRGQATMTAGEAGYVTLGGVVFRSMDFYSSVMEVGPVGTL